ncbi:hypothetical protein GC194_10160 [bacterium]|nr:hypothetical protein [bacterium]
MAIGILQKIGLSKILIGIVAVATAATLVLTNPFKSQSAQTLETMEVDPAYGNYISGYTSGILSTQAHIRISFTQNVIDSFKYEMVADDDLFDFSPSIEGKAYWIDASTIEYRPTESLPYNSGYKVQFALSKVMEVSDDELSTFEFAFNTLELNVELDVYGISFIENESGNEQVVRGSFVCSDFLDSTLAEEMMQARQNDNTLKVSWTHRADCRQHSFVIHQVAREKRKSKVSISYELDNNNATIEGDEEIEIPAIGEFVFIGGSVVHNPDQYVSIRFSDPISTSQNLKGLITVGTIDFDYEVKGNEIRLFPTTRQNGEVDVRVRKAIKSEKGDVLEQDFTFHAVFEQLKPEVRWVDDGNLIPDGENMVLPFEAVALNAVDVEVVKIPANNLKQFFQVNQLDGNEELRRVGRPVVRKTVSLQNSGVANLMKWNRFSLDLSELANTEPDALYQVHISFRMQQTAYQCSETDSITEQEWREMDWDHPQHYYYYDYYYYRGYSYRERENPCNISYYVYHGTGITKNLYKSNIGIIAKQGKFNNLNFAVTSLQSTEPLSGAKIAIYDYQQQLLKTTETNADGLAEIKLENVPFLAVVSHGGQKNYLRLDNNPILSLSHFNTSGVESKSGYKGYIYGERGVWRPGDSLFLTFMLEDKHKLLPKNHPILFELEDPRGRIRSKLMKSSNETNVYAFKTKTETSDPTGMWLARVSVGNNVFTKSLPIETIKPNRLKINLNLDKEQVTAADPYLRGTLNARWLHGAIAKNMDAKIEATLYPVNTTFKKYDGFDFDDEAKRIGTESLEIFNGKLDDKGNATIEADLSPSEKSPGKVIAKLKTTVTEHSGNSSIDLFEVPFYPYESFVGMKVPTGRYGWLQTDTSHLIQLACVNTDGNPITGTRTVQYELWKVDFRWWWDRSSDNLSNYVNNSYRKPIISQSTTITNGKGSFNLTIDRPNWGRYYLRVYDPISGHSTGKVIYVSWPYWAGKSNEQAGISVLEFTADKEDYLVNEKAKIKIPGTPNGRALVSIENASGVLKQFWLTTEKGQTTFDLDISPEMAPNVYVHISQIQPHGQTENDLPIRLYGIINLNVKAPETVLSPQIAMPDVLAPEEKFAVTVSEKSGKAMTYTLAVVDEGLLDLTRFKTPDPHAEFYAKEALGVNTYDLYKYVVGSTNGELANVLGIGGDMASNAGEETELNRFKPVVKFIGPFTLKPGEKKTHNIKMPYYVGSVRTMVVARQAQAYGNTEKATPVRKPLMVLATLPRVLSPGEEVSLPVSVFAMEDKVKSADVSVETNELFEVLPPAKQTIRFSEPGEEMAYFRLKVKTKIGVGIALINAVSGSEKAKDEIKLQVRAPNPPISLVNNGILEGNKTLNLNYKAIGIEGTNKGALEVSTIPPLNLEKNLEYLIGYPHGCVEQTTSRGFAQLFLGDITELSNAQKLSIERNINATIARLATMQTIDGGFAYWPGDLVANEWGSNYAGHFLIEAQKKGYTVPASLLKNWRKFQQRLADAYDGNTSHNSHYTHYNNGLNQAYRLYTLAAAGAPDMGAMNRLRTENDLSVSGSWRLAGAYAKAGQTDIANKIIFDLPTKVSRYTELSYTYGSDLRDMAMILEVLTELNEKIKAALVLKDMSARMADSRWWSTQTTAYCLLAASKFSMLNKSNDPINFNYTFKGQTMRNASTGMPVANIQLTEAELRAGNVKIENKSGNVFYVQLTTTGQPLENDSINTSSDLNMYVRYTDMTGGEIKPDEIVQGSSFMAIVEVSNPGVRGYYSEMALTQMFPSGWEIVNTRFEGTENLTYKSSPYTYRDYRDDRVLTYFNIAERERLTYIVLLNASYAGKFYLPSVSCNAMYDNTISATVAGQWVKVVSPGNN